MDEVLPVWEDALIVSDELMLMSSDIECQAWDSQMVEFARW